MINARYVLLALLASASIMAAIVARLFPDALSIMDEEKSRILINNWRYLLAIGVVVGAVNAGLTFNSRASNRGRSQYLR